MGRANVQAIREFLSEQRTLEWHLQNNHHPPVSLDWLPICVKVLNRAVESAVHEDADILEEKIETPNGPMTVLQVYEGLHLEALLEARLGEGDDDV